MADNTGSSGKIEKLLAKTKHILQKLKRLPHFNPWLAVLMAFTFGIVGSYMLFNGRAASTSVMVEAESLTLPAGTSVVTDNSAQGGKAILMAQNGRATGTVSSEYPITQVAVRAKSQSCRGNAEIKIVIDGKTTMITTISSTVWAEFPATLNLPAGTYSLEVSYTNDYHYNHRKKPCDRNLYVDSVGFVQQSPTGDSQPPAVQLTSPSNGAVVSNAVSLTASASHSTGIAGIQFKIDGSNYETEDTSAPYSVTWDASRSTSGSHTVSATARSTSGLTTTATITVTVQSPEPVPSTGLAPGISTGGAIWFFGQTDVENEMQTVKDLRAAWVRVDMYWDKVETSKGSYQWAQADRIWNAAKSRGLKVLWVYHRTPSWARGNAGTSLRYPTNASDYGNFAAVSAKRYPGSAWEFWNEPNGSWAAENVGAAGQAKLAQMVMDAIGKVRTADPAAILVGPGILRGGSAGSTSYVLDTEFLKGLYAGGLQPGKLDALGYHAYSFPWSPKDTRTDVNQGWNQLAKYVDTARANGDNSKVWLTEQGQQTGGELAVSEATQAQFVIDAFDRYRQEFSAGRVTGPFFWYQQRDGGPQPYSSREEAFGLTRYDRSRKAAWDAFVTQAGLLQ
jgi:hypothetical protein